MKTTIMICVSLFVLIWLSYYGYVKAWDRRLVQLIRIISIRKGMLNIVVEIAYWIDRLVLKRIRFFARLKYKKTRTVEDLIEIDDIDDRLEVFNYDISDIIETESEFANKRFQRMMEKWESSGRKRIDSHRSAVSNLQS